MSIINIESVKEAILAAVDRAIEECALQHDAADRTYFGPKGVEDSQPVKASIKLEFYWPGSTKSQLYCNPIIELEKCIK